MQCAALCDATGGRGALAQGRATAAHPRLRGTMLSIASLGPRTSATRDATYSKQSWRSTALHRVCPTPPEGGRVSGRAGDGRTLDALPRSVLVAAAASRPAASRPAPHGSVLGRRDSSRKHATVTPRKRVPYSHFAPSRGWSESARARRQAHGRLADVPVVIGVRRYDERTCAQFAHAVEAVRT
jgi:hypothetical protein